MACGTPIAAAQGGAAADIIRQAGAGEVVAVGDAEALCQAVLRLLDNPSLRQQCASSARAYAEAHFDNAQVMARYADVILKAARPRSGA
jgi:glycosyltransferase involved in cell wall biosynthesis